MTKQLLVTGSNQHPEINDDWCTAIQLDTTKDYTKEELVELVKNENPSYQGYALWIYEGKDYEDKTTGRKLVNGTIVYDMLFHPWDTNDVKLVSKITPQKQALIDDDSLFLWKKEIAMEAGMMGGCEAYNDVMGY